MKNNIKTIILLTISLLLLGMSSCKTKEVPGRRRTPRHCNTCTKWSYAPQIRNIDTLALPPMSYRPTKEERIWGRKDMVQPADKNLRFDIC